MLLTVAIPTYDDYRGLDLTIQSLRLHHPGEEFEIVVFDNFGCELSKNCCIKSGVKYVANNDVKGTCYAKSMAIRESNGEFVLVIDSHVLLGIGAISKLRQYLETNRNSRDILHGPLMSNKGKILATEQTKMWRGQSWGIWHDRTENGKKPLPEVWPSEIWGHGCGLFCVKKAFWPDYHPRCRGFGGEEGAIQEQYRARGGKALLLPFLNWTHSFNDAKSVKHKIFSSDKFRNYMLNLTGLPDALQLWSDCILHFSGKLNLETIKEICAECLPAGLEITSSIGIKTS